MSWSYQSTYASWYQQPYLLLSSFLSISSSTITETSSISIEVLSRICSTTYGETFSLTFGRVAEGIYVNTLSNFPECDWSISALNVVTSARMATKLSTPGMKPPSFSLRSFWSAFLVSQSNLSPCDCKICFTSFISSRRGSKAKWLSKIWLDKRFTLELAAISKEPILSNIG